MKKQMILIIGLFLMLIVVGLCGCNEKSDKTVDNLLPERNDKKNIIGLWEDKNELFWLFTEDGKLYDGWSLEELPDNIREEILENSKDYFYDYELKDGYLYQNVNQTCLDPSVEPFVFTYRYRFDNVDKLILDGVNTLDATLHRVK